MRLRIWPLVAGVHRLVVVYVLVACLGVPCFADLRLRSAANEFGLGDEGEANGAAFGDIDADGWPDLFVARLGRDEPSLLYRNRAGSFVLEPDWAAPQGAMGGLFADMDSDGDEDLFIILHQGPNQLHRNEAGMLVPVPATDNYQESFSAVSALFADLTGDHRLDVFNTHRRFSPNQLIGDFGSGLEKDLSHVVGSLRSGVESFAAAPIDFDSDGDLDIYVTSFTELNLLHSNDGRGRFRLVAGAAGMDSRGPSLAALPADFDDDGDTDLLVLNGDETANELYMNEDGQFRDVTVMVGLEGAESTSAAMWADFDSDGDLDLLTAHLGQPARLFRNDQKRFWDVSASALEADMQPFTAGIAVADVDLDGDLDVYLAAPRLPDVLLENESSSGGWIRIDFTDPLLAGTRIDVVDAQGSRQTRTYSPLSALGTSFDGAMQIGIGAAASARVQIRWPGGQIDDAGDVESGSVVAPERRRLNHDLGIVSVTAPDLDYGWGEVLPQVEIRNAGLLSAESRVRWRIEGPEGMEAEQIRQSPVLASGQHAQIQFSPWHPPGPGSYRFEFHLLSTDDLPDNDHWSRQHLLHGFQDAAQRLGVVDSGHGWAAVFGDIENDGDLDLYVSNGGTLGAGANALYRNEGNRFVDITLASGASDEGNGTSVVFADFDRDGDQDLFLSKGGFNPLGERNRLLHNDGSGKFIDVSAQSGLDRIASSYAAVLGDYDTDGYLDLYVAQLRGQDNRLYHNTGSGFDDVSGLRRIQSFFRNSSSSGVFSDFDQDGDLELYTGIFGDYDQIYSEAGVDPYSVQSVGDRGENVGMALGDVDGDAAGDFYVVNLNGRSVLFLNDLLAEQFVDVSTERGTENQAVGTGCAFADLDADGDLDLLVSNLNSGTRAYINDGDGFFEDFAVPFGVADDRPSRAVIVGDIDNDGDEDFYIVNEAGANGLYLNGGVGGRRFLKVRVRGVASNPDGVGARVVASIDGRQVMREVNGTAGSSYSDRTLFFGMGEHGTVDSLAIVWPAGGRDRLGSIPVNSTIEWVEGRRPTPVAESPSTVPERAWLGQNFPNPFNPATMLRFGVARPGRIRLQIFNVTGQHIRSLIDARLESGEHAVEWDGTNADHAMVATGVYVARFVADGDVIAYRLMTLLR